VTGVAALTVPAVILNDAEVAPAATITVAGTLAALVLELESDTTAPPEGAADVSVTFPFSVLSPESVLEFTVTLLSAAGGLTVALTVLFTPS